MTQNEFCTFLQWPCFSFVCRLWLVHPSVDVHTATDLALVVLALPSGFFLSDDIVVIVLIKHLLLALMQTMICEPQNSTH